MTLTDHIRAWIAEKRAQDITLATTQFNMPLDWRVESTQERVLEELEGLLLFFEHVEEGEMNEMAKYYSQAEKRETYE